MEEINKNLPAGVEAVTVYDRTQLVDKAVSIYKEVGGDVGVVPASGSKVITLPARVRFADVLSVLRTAPSANTEKEGAIPPLRGSKPRSRWSVRADRFATSTPSPSDVFHEASVTSTPIRLALTAPGHAVQ